MKVEVDRRSCVVQEEREAEELLRNGARRYARMEADYAKAFARMERSRSYLRHDHRSLESWGAAQGYGERQVKHLVSVGRALIASPALEQKVRACKVPAESAIQVHRVVRAGGDPAEWLEKAESLGSKELANQANKAIEDARQQETTFPIRFHVSRTSYERFYRARRLMSKGSGPLLTEGQAFAGLVDEYLERHDPRRKPLPQRRSGPTAGRYVSARVAAEVERRSGGECEICGERRATEKMHLRVPHAMGGGREADNIGDGCHGCHTLFDAGVYEFVGFEANGKPRFTLHSDRLVRERAPPYLAA